VDLLPDVCSIEVREHRAATERQLRLPSELFIFLTLPKRQCPQL
jgi:hypothetical protein